MRIVDPEIQALGSRHGSVAVTLGPGHRESLRMGCGASKPTTKDADDIFKKIDANKDGMVQYW